MVVDSVVRVATMERWIVSGQWHDDKEKDADETINSNVVHSQLVLR